MSRASSHQTIKDGESDMSSFMLESRTYKVLSCEDRKMLYILSIKTGPREVAVEESSQLCPQTGCTGLPGRLYRPCQGTVPPGLVPVQPPGWGPLPSDMSRWRGGGGTVVLVNPVQRVPRAVVPPALLNQSSGLW